MKSLGGLAWLALGALALFYAGCALTSKGTAITPRYFSPELRGQSSETPVGAAGSPRELRLGQVEAASHLEERMSYRVRASEVGYYEDRRWTEEPAEYLRRALEQELFEHRHVRRIVSGNANTLDVELTAFEELRDPSPHVRLALHFTLHDEREASLERSVVVERPLRGGPDRAAEVASALGSALTTAVAEVSDAVLESLPRVATAPCASPSANAE